MIRRAAQGCASQNDLARRIGTNSGNLANVKAGRKVLTVDQVVRLARLAGENPERVWTLMQLARLPHRSPFAQRPD